MLSGYRVLDLSDELGQLAGRILADLGADVILVEPPHGMAVRRRGLVDDEDGDRLEPSMRFVVSNAGKRSIALDLTATDDRACFDALVAGADVVIDSARAPARSMLGLEPERLESLLPAEHPGLVHCAITPFGQTGPRAGWHAGDLVTVAMGGNMAMTGDPGRAPVRCSLPTSAFHGGAEAALAIVLALHARRRTGEGQLVDVSLQECQLGTLLGGPGMFAASGQRSGRGGARTGRTREIWRCADGWVSYGLRGGPARAGSLAATVALMHEHGLAPQWLREMDWARYSPLTLSDAELERLEAVFGAFFETQTMRSLYETALERRILLAPCNDAREILAQPQLRARSFFVELHQGDHDIEVPAFFARSSRCAIGVRGHAPGLDADGGAIRRELAHEPRRARETESYAEAPLETRVTGDGALTGLRVLELGAGAAGPVSTGHLAEQGATVIRIESANRPDFLRLLHVTAANRDTPGILDQAPMFAMLNAGKQSLTLDLKQAEGVALVERLVAEWADVVAENFAPGVMERFGLGWERLSHLNPRLVMVRGCLFGQTGPQKDYPGFGGQGAAIAGFNHLTGWPDAEALGPYATITDSLSPRFVATALLAALLERDQTGRGQCLDVSQIETGVYCLAEAIARQSAFGETLSRQGNASEVAAPHGVFPCRRDEEGGRERWIAVAVRDDAAWKALVGVLGHPAWAVRSELASTSGRLAARAGIEAELARFTASQDAFELAELLQQAGIEAGPVQDFEDLLADPQLAHRGHFVRLEHGALGPLEYERRGYRLGATPGRVQAPAPLLGEHTHRVLSEVLHLEDDEIARLERAGVTT